jgi:hypothetical protein
MQPEDHTLDQPTPQKPAPLDYQPPRERRGLKYWLFRLLSRMSKPMPLAMYYLIMFVLSFVALVLALIIRLIVSAFK